MGKQEQNNGAPCTGDTVRETDCNTIDCSAVDCEWSSWSTATTCSKTCGGGKNLQTRTIVKQQQNNGAHCNGENLRETDCNTTACPKVDCQYSNWGHWSECYDSKNGKFGTGTKFKIRNIVRSEENGGASCSGSNIEETDCH